MVHDGVEWIHNAHSCFQSLSLSEWEILHHCIFSGNFVSLLTFEELVTAFLDTRELNKWSHRVKSLFRKQVSVDSLILPELPAGEGSKL